MKTLVEYDQWHPDMLTSATRRDRTVAGFNNIFGYVTLGISPRGGAKIRGR